MRSLPGSLGTDWLL